MKSNTVSWLWVLIFLALSSALFAAASPYRLAVSDFRIQSANPQYKYLGKGFTEFISIEISKSSDISLIERERRNELLEEQEFSLSDLSDQSSQVIIGKLLAADFILAGNIFEIAGKLVVTIRLVDVTTGQVVLQDKVSGGLASYDSISASLARLVLTHFKAKIPKGTEEKSEALEIAMAEAASGGETEADTAAAEQKAKPVEVVIRFSKAIDAYDKKEIDVAKKELRKARKLDPKNEAVQIYLDKLTLNTSKFKTISEMYYPNQNPAYLGIIDYDQLFFSSSWINNTETQTPIAGYSDRYIMEQEDRGNLGCSLPIGEVWGLGAQIFGYHYKHALYDNESQLVDTNPEGFGAILSLGRSLGSRMAFGASVSLYKQTRELENQVQSEETDNFLRQAFSLGFLVCNELSTLVFDAQLGFSTEKPLALDPSDITKGEEVMAPLFMENTLSWALNEKRTFLVLKQTNDLHLDRAFYTGRLIPAIEHWFLSWTAVRAGVEGNFTHLEGINSVGIGATGGLTLRIPPWGLDMDLSLTYRERPSRVVPGQKVKEFIPMVLISRKNNLIAR